MYRVPGPGLYLLVRGGRYKVGMTRHLERRRDGIGGRALAFVPCPTEVVARRQERLAHRRLAAFRLEGEWFRFESEAHAVHEFRRAAVSNCAGRRLGRPALTPEERRERARDRKRRWRAIRRTRRRPGAAPGVR